MNDGSPFEVEEAQEAFTGERSPEDLRDESNRTDKAQSQRRNSPASRSETSELPTEEMEDVSSEDVSAQDLPVQEDDEVDTGQAEDLPAQDVEDAASVRADDVGQVETGPAEDIPVQEVEDNEPAQTAQAVEDGDQVRSDEPEDIPVQEVQDDEPVQTAHAAEERDPIQLNQADDLPAGDVEGTDMVDELESDQAEDIHVPDVEDGDPVRPTAQSAPDSEPVEPDPVEDITAAQDLEDGNTPPPLVQPEDEEPVETDPSQNIAAAQDFEDGNTLPPPVQPEDEELVETDPSQNTAAAQDLEDSNTSPPPVQPEDEELVETPQAASASEPVQGAEDFAPLPTEDDGGDAVSLTDTLNAALAAAQPHRSTDDNVGLGNPQIISIQPAEADAIRSEAAQAKIENPDDETEHEPEPTFTLDTSEPRRNEPGEAERWVIVEPGASTDVDVDAQPATNAEPDIEVYAETDIGKNVAEPPDPALLVKLAEALDGTVADLIGSDWRPDAPSDTGAYPEWPEIRERVWKRLAHLELERRAKGSDGPPVESGLLRMRHNLAELPEEKLRDIAATGRSVDGMELEHKIPQRVVGYLIKAGLDESTASRLAHLGDPANLYLIPAELHAVFDAYAKFGRNPSLPAAWDDRKEFPLSSMTPEQLDDLAKALGRVREGVDAERLRWKEDREKDPPGSMSNQQLRAYESTLNKRGRALDNREQALSTIENHLANERLRWKNDESMRGVPARPEHFRKTV